MIVHSRGILPSGSELRIQYEGMTVPTEAGISVAAALTAAGIGAFRSSATGDRGLFCGMGICGECAITIDGHAGQLACMTKVHEGMRMARQPRKLAIDVNSTVEPAGTESELTPEVLVVGGGPAGLSAAAVAAEAGVDVLLVDERTALGGQYYKQPASSFTVDAANLDAQYKAGRALMSRVEQAGVRVLSGVRVWGAAGPGELFASRGAERWTFRPRRLVLATGAYERAVPFPGWTLPGVMTTGAAQSLLRAYQVAPGERLLVAGNGPLNLQLAAELVRAGGVVVGVAELAAVTSLRHALDVARMVGYAPGLVRDGVGYLGSLRRAGVPLLTRSAVVRVEGDGRAEHAVVARLDRAGEVIRGTERRFDVDAVCVGLGFMPGNELARLLGVRYSVDRRTGGYVLETTPSGRTDVPGVWVVGDTADTRGAKVAQNAGLLAGADVAESLSRAAPNVRTAARRRLRHERFQRALWRTFRGPSLFDQLAEMDTVICRCESVSLAAVDARLRDVRSSGALKRVTRAGMGHCQGRMCGFVVTERVATTTGMSVDALAGFATQPPARPTPLAVLAAEANDAAE